MNRLKKNIRRKGIKLNSDYPCLPYYVKGKSMFEPGYICVEDVKVVSETATIFRFLNIGREIITLERNGELKSVDFD